MKIIKIGGASFDDQSNFSGLIKYIKSLDTSFLCVISAFGKVSSDLKYFTNNCSSSNISNIPLKLFKKYLPLLNKNNRQDFEEYLDDIIALINYRLEGIIITGELHYAVLDEILSYGELISSYFIHCLFNSHNIQNIYLDSREIIFTDDNYGNAKPNIALSINKINEEIKNDNNYIVQGFIGSDSSGRTTTMGFESSNLSAMIFAMALKSEKIEIITKVNQIYTFDPDLSDKAKPIDSIPFTSAKLLADNNFKMLFPGIIDIAQKSGIEILYRGIANGVGTLISESDKFTLPVILPTKESIVIAPINKHNAIQIINKFEKNLKEYKFDQNNNSLKVKVIDLDIQDIHNFVITLF